MLPSFRYLVLRILENIISIWGWESIGQENDDGCIQNCNQFRGHPQRIIFFYFETNTFLRGGRGERVSVRLVWDVGRDLLEKGKACFLHFANCVISILLLEIYEIGSG